MPVLVFVLMFGCAASFDAASLFVGRWKP
jgi:hypothetical protein